MSSPTDLKTAPELVAYISHIMFERHLTDIAGGNVSMREGNTIYISPRYAGTRWHWNLSPKDIVSGPVDTDELLQSSSFSREGLSHITVYRAFPEVKAIIHAHPPNILPFCAIERPIEPVLRATQKYGTLEYIDNVAPYGQEQADSIVKHLHGKEELMNSTAAALLMPQHGIILAGQDLWVTLDALERINVNAWCILAQGMLANLPK